MVEIELVWAINSTFMHGFQIISHYRSFQTFFSGKLKVKVILEGQTKKWSLASVNIVNLNFWCINIKKSLLSKHDDCLASV